jgi:hypothetical protein
MLLPLGIPSDLKKISMMQTSTMTVMAIALMTSPRVIRLIKPGRTHNPEKNQLKAGIISKTDISQIYVLSDPFSGIDTSPIL